MGKSRLNNMYVRGVEYLNGNLSTESMIFVDLDESALAGVSSDEKPEETKKVKGGEKQTEKSGLDKSKPTVNQPIPILVTLYAMPSIKSNGEYAQTERVIFIGCMKSSSEKKDAKKVKNK